MDNAANTTGEQQIACSGFSICASVDQPSAGLLDPATGSIQLSASGPLKDGNVSLKADGRVTSSVAQSHIDVVAGGIVLDAGDKGNIGTRAGTAPFMQHVELQGNGGNVLLENGQIPLSPKIEIQPDAIVLSVGPNKITIGPTGIEICGLEVTVEGELAATVKGLDVTINGELATTVQGGAETTIKGAIVMIN